MLLREIPAEGRGEVSLYLLYQIGDNHRDIAAIRGSSRFIGREGFSGEPGARQLTSKKSKSVSYLFHQVSLAALEAAAFII